MKKNAKCVVLIMSAGSGTRFGADKPKQYCLLAGKPIIEYALDVCRHSSSVDEAVIVASADYLDYLRDKYHFPVTLGGDNRTKSLANGLKFVHDNYECEKIIIVNAVCPLMTAEQLDRYFNLLDEYDYVLTTWKVVSTLGKFDGTLVDRNDYFQCMEPEAYRFELLYENYKCDYPVPYIFHQLPTGSRGYYCFDYPYTMKITYPRDVQIAEILYKEEIMRPRDLATEHKINAWLSAFGDNQSVIDWMVGMPSYLKILKDKWDLSVYSMNPQTFATCVYESKSQKYGDVIVKLHAPTGRYEVEKEYYLQSASNEHMARLLDYDDDYRALLIERIKPGLQVKYDRNDYRLDDLFKDFLEHLIPARRLPTGIEFPTILKEFEQSKQLADQYSFDPSFRTRVQFIAERIWCDFFAEAEQYFLHRDLHRRNLLSSSDSIIAIDPLGVIGPKEFEFTISILIESKANVGKECEIIEKMLNHYSEYCDSVRLRAALFITLVHKMNEYVFSKYDEYALAKWVGGLIERYYFKGSDSVTPDDYEKILLI